MDKNKQSLIDLAAQVSTLARSVADAIMPMYRAQVIETRAKPDLSPITAADELAHEIIVRGLKSVSSELVVSEEGHESIPHQMPGRFWLVDPIDGTRDFVARLDTFVTSIGLVEDGAPILGVIYAPVFGWGWWSVRGCGSFGPNGERLTHAETRSKMKFVGSRSLRSEWLDRLGEKVLVEGITHMGSAMKFCKLAAGDFDCYPRLGRTFEWDTVAGQLIAEEAGCEVISLKTGKQLKYGKPGLLNDGGFVAQKNGLEIAEIVRTLVKTTKG